MKETTYTNLEKKLIEVLPLGGEHPQGYYIIANNLEKRRYIKSLWSQTNQMNLLIAALEKIEVE